jgi:hypothetical protein
MLLIPVLNPPTKAKEKKVATKKKSTKKKSGSKRSSSRRSSSVVRTKSRKGKHGITWTEAAHVSGAVYGATYPKWHEKAGQSTGSSKGKAMSKFDALRAKRKVVGYINQNMLNFWYKPQKLAVGMAKIKPANLKPGDPRLQFAQDWWSKAEKKQAQLRKDRGTPWKRHPQRYKKGNKATGVKKGQRKKDYKVERGKVKFRSGRGPRTSVTVFRGFSPTKRQIDRLVEGGFAGHLTAKGGKVKLNKPRRRKKARKRRNPAKKRRTSARKKSVRKNPRRRKAKAKANPKRRRKAKAKANPKHRRRRRTKARKNPGRKTRTRTRARRGKRKGVAKKTALKKKGGRRRRRKSTGMRRYSKNPMGILKAMIKDVQSAPKWITAGHILVGAGTTAAGCSWLLTRGPLANVRFLQQRGVIGSLSRLALCGMGAGVVAFAGDSLSKALGRPKALAGARTNLLIGGMAYALANFFYEVAPQVAEMFMIPQVSAPVRRSRLSASLPAGGDLDGYGYGTHGMGAVMSPEDLVAGESLARNVNEFSGMGDWMELSGMGSSGGSPIPMEDLRGYPGQYGGGMGDWIEMGPNAELVQQGFAPGVEAF